MTKKKDETQAPSRDPIESSWRGVTVWLSPIEGDAYDSEERDAVIAHINHYYPERSLSVTEALTLERVDAGLPPVAASPETPKTEPAPAKAAAEPVKAKAKDAAPETPSPEPAAPVKATPDEPEKGK